MKKMIIELIAIKKIINNSMNLLFINKIKIKGIYPAIINIPLSKLHSNDEILHHDTSKMEHIYLAGGEPFMIPTYYKLLSSIQDKTYPEVVINTNLSRLTTEWMNLIKL